MSKQIVCKLCSSPKNIKIHEGVRHDGDAKIYQCVDCSFVFLSPWPTENELNQYYADQYRDHYEEPPISTRLRRDTDEARVRMQRLLPLVSSPKHPTKILEIGSGSGAFLDAARPYFEEVVAIEPDIDSQHWIAEKLNFLVYPALPENSLMCEKFDLIVMFHVLEHISEPVEFLNHVAKFAHSETKLIIEVPNIDDALISLYQIAAYQDFYYQKAHLSYYSAQTLEKALLQGGWSADIDFLQRYDLSNHIQWMQTGKPGGQGHYQIFDSTLNSAYADSLVRSGRADTLWAISTLQ